MEHMEHKGAKLYSLLTESSEDRVKNPVYFEIIGEIEKIETIAIGGGIRDIMRIQKQYGPGRWRKLKGIAKVRLESGRVCRAELHWYEAHGIGRKKMKIKRFLD
jgi:hypothetical protein